jgi:hypothetical protein
VFAGGFVAIPESEVMAVCGTAWDAPHLSEVECALYQISVRVQVPSIAFAVQKRQHCNR